MSIFDQDWLQNGIGDLGESAEDSASHAALPTTMRFMDDHGENVTKAFMIAALAYAGMGGAFGGGAGGGEAAGGAAGGGGGSGGAFPTFGKSAIGGIGNLLGGLGGGGGQQQQPMMPQYNPFSPQQPEKEDPYRPMQFANNSFSPWAHNVTSAMVKPTSIVPYREEAEHIFSKGKGLFA